MILALVSLFILAIGGVGFYSMSTNEALNNTFYALDYSLPRLWVVTDVEEKLEQPFYDTVKVEETTIEHFKNNLAHYVYKFKVGFYYFDEETLEEVTDRYVTGVRLSLRADIPFSKEYYKAMTYLISHQEDL